MANYKVAVENGNNILVTVDRGVSGVGIENIEMVFISPDYFLKFFTQTAQLSLYYCLKQ